MLGSGILPLGLDPELVFAYVYAVLYSPEYRRRYAEQLQRDYPRVPIPAQVQLFKSLSALGAKLVKLHTFDSTPTSGAVASSTHTGELSVEVVSYLSGTVWLDKSKSAGIEGVPQQVWDFHIGGYRPCEKWLKDRRGRRLSSSELTHYRTIVTAISGTIGLMTEIDQAIEKHGGWPGAFTSA